MEKFGVIKKRTLVFYIEWLCIASYAILENVSISIPEFTKLKRPLLIIAALCLFGQYKFIWNRIWRKEYRETTVLTGLFIITLLFSAMRNSGAMAGTMNLILFLVELFVGMLNAAENEKAEMIFNFLFWYAFILMVINDLLIFSGIISFTDGTYKTYLVGTKFSVSYLHIYLLAFYFVKNYSKLRFNLRYAAILLLFGGAVIYISIRVDCNTGIIGCLLLMVLIVSFKIFPYRCLREFATARVFVIFLIGSVFISFLLESIVSIPFIKRFITDLGRTTTLTGRTEIFALYVIRMAGHWLWGYGYGNAYSTSMSLFGYANAQNGLLQWILQVGIIPVIIMVMLFALFFKKLSIHNNIMEIMPLIALIYVFIVLGAIEITFSMNFMMWMWLIFMWSHQKDGGEIHR